MPSGGALRRLLLSLLLSGPSHAAWLGRTVPSALRCPSPSAHAHQLVVMQLNDKNAIEMRRPVIMQYRRVFALIFNAGTENEGIYSRRSAEDGIDMILCFEEKDDAHRYTMMLAAQDFPEAEPVEIDSHMLLEFCDESGHKLGLVTEDSLVVPPEANVPMFDWSPGVSAEGILPPEEISMDELEHRRKVLESLL